MTDKNSLKLSRLWTKQGRFTIDNTRSPPCSVKLLLRTWFQCECRTWWILTAYGVSHIRILKNGVVKVGRLRLHQVTLSQWQAWRWSRVIWNDHEWPNFNVTSEHSYGGTEEIHKEIQPHPMSRLALGTSQTLNSGICYGKRKSPTQSSWTTDADKNETGTTAATLLLRE